MCCVEEKIMIHGAQVQLSGFFFLSHSQLIINLPTSAENAPRRFACTTWKCWIADSNEIQLASLSLKRLSRWFRCWRFFWIADRFSTNFQLVPLKINQLRWLTRLYTNLRFTLGWSVKAHTETTMSLVHSHMVGLDYFLLHFNPSTKCN